MVFAIRDPDDSDHRENINKLVMTLNAISEQKS